MSDSSGRDPAVVDGRLAPFGAQPRDQQRPGAVVWNIPVACNRSSADFLISSPLMSDGYNRIQPEYAAAMS